MFGGRKTWFAVGLALTLVGLGGLASEASANFHQMKIREVSPGTGVANSSYIEIQAYSAGERFLSLGAKVLRCDATCSSPTVFSPFSDVANGADQMTVVFGDTGLASGSKDFTIPLDLDSIMAGGAVCYLSEPGFSDCVSWGNFSADATLMGNPTIGTSAGTPAPALVTGMALRRSISGGLCSTALDPVDDTNNSAADFTQTTPDPRPNSAPIAEMPCSTPASPVNPAGNVRRRKCKKKHRSASPTPPAYSAKKHKCKKKKRR